jgi:hypothetical protein
MGGWGQALGQTFGQVGNDASAASQANTDRQLNIALAKLQQQQIEQQMKVQQQEMQIRGAPSTTYLPTPGGGTVASQIPALGGQPKVTPVVPDQAVPHALSDVSIAAAAKALPPNVPPELFTTVVTGLRDMGQYDKALEFMGKQGVARPSVREALEPDPQSPTGYSKVSYDPVTGQELSRQQNVQPPASSIGSNRSTTDPVSGLTTTSTTRKVLPGSTALGSGRPAAPPRPPQPFAAAANVPSPSTNPSGAAFRVRVIQQEADDWATRGIKPSGGAKEEAVVRRWMAAQKPPLTPAPANTGELTTGAQKVLIQAEPVLSQIDRIKKDIKDLGLTDNNQPAWVPGSPLFLATAQYKLGIDSPPGTLGKDIADLSLGSLVEATSALTAQGGGSRSLQALKIALQHTPNPTVDSPRLILTKLDNIQQRLNDVVNEAKTVGQKHYRADQQAPDNGGGWDQIAHGPKGDIGLRNGKWYFVATGKEYAP